MIILYNMLYCYGLKYPIVYEMVSITHLEQQQY